MDYSTYISTFSDVGICQRLKEMRDKKEITAPYYDAVSRLIGKAVTALTPSKRTIMTAEYERLLNHLLVYELVRLDYQKYYLAKGVKNLRLNARTLIDRLLEMDYLMYFFPSLDVERSVTTIMVIVALKQCLLLNKKIRIEAIHRLSADLNKDELRRSFEEAQRIFNDNYLFNKDTLKSKSGVIEWIEASMPVDTRGKTVAN